MNDTPKPDREPASEIEELLERLEEAEPDEAVEPAEALADRLAAGIETRTDDTR